MADMQWGGVLFLKRLYFYYDSWFLQLSRVSFRHIVLFDCFYLLIIKIRQNFCPGQKLVRSADLATLYQTYSQISFMTKLGGKMETNEKVWNGFWRCLDRNGNILDHVFWNLFKMMPLLWHLISHPKCWYRWTNRTTHYFPNAQGLESKTLPQVQNLGFEENSKFSEHSSIGTRNGLSFPIWFIVYRNYCAKYAPLLVF